MFAAALGLPHLAGEGFEVLHAASAEAALVLAVQQPVSLITLDILLPNADGWEFLSRFKHVPDFWRTPVVIISIVAVVDDDSMALELIAVSIMGLASTVLRAHGGREAIDAARWELPDVIVLDLMMRWRYSCSSRQAMQCSALQG